jgi:hypothetical protein
MMEFVKDTPSDWIEKRWMAAERLKVKFETQQKQVGYYLQQAQDQRAKSISTSTLTDWGS